MQNPLEETKSGMSPALWPSSRTSQPQLHELTEKFEALMAGFLVRSLRQAMSSSGFYGSAYGGEMFQGMMDEVLAQTLASRANLGISEALDKQLGRREAPDRGLEAGAGSRQPLNEIVDAAARRYGVDADLVRAVIQQESAGNVFAESEKGAGGLMQLMPATATELGIRNRFDAEENIHGGTRYLAGLLQRFGTLENALAAYNAGPEAVERCNGIPAYAETQNYVARVLEIYRSLRPQAGYSQDGMDGVDRE